MTPPDPSTKSRVIPPFKYLDRRTARKSGSAHCADQSRQLFRKQRAFDPDALTTFNFVPVCYYLNQKHMAELEFYLNILVISYFFLG